MKAKRTGKPVFFIIFILILALTYTAFFGIDEYYGDKRVIYAKGANDIRWGIDIKGGVEAVFSPELEDAKITSEDMDAAKQIVETRLVSRNITDYEIYVDNDAHQIIVRFPWAANESNFDPSKTVEELGGTAKLTFCRGTDQEDVIMDGSAVESAAAGVNEDGEYIVSLSLNSDGKGKFATATSEMVGQQISIYLDGENKSTATVQEAITNGKAQITMGKGASADDAKILADTINAGALPFELNQGDSKLQIISPTLGSSALRVMLIAGAIAFGIVCLIMILRYRLNGFIASLALLGQLAGTVACISGFFSNVDSFTLTIPGIAGIILSVGVGVDCNVIAAERIRDEFKKGKTIDGSIDSGYKNALSAIIDGNVTIVIVSIVLIGAFGTPDNIIAKIFSPIMHFFGTAITGSIFSFGYTLLVGVIFNLIMGVLASKYMLKSISQLKFLRKPWLYGGKKNA